MKQNLHQYRKSYERGELTLESVFENPFQQFEHWFKVAEASEDIDEVNAMTLSTIGTDGFPRGRVVLLKEVSEEGFVLYTNYGSEKGESIAHTNRVCLSFFWPALEQQIIIKGEAYKTTEEQSVAYFRNRPRESQLGALVSNQSKPIESREALEEKCAVLARQYESKEIPKPENWGGYRIIPVAFEFWQGRQSRLHDRIQYTKEGKDWKLQRVQP